MKNNKLPIGPKVKGSITYSESYDFSDPNVRNEEDFLINELEIPYLKVNNRLEVLMWNTPFKAMTKVSDEQLTMLSLKEISLQSPIISFCVDLIEEALSTNTRQDDDVEEEDHLFLVSAIPNERSNVVYLFIEDRTLQKQFDNLLTFHHQIEAASHIAAGVAHELRNPLSVIKGFLQLAKLTEDFHKYYDTIMSELNRMNGIIEDFLSVSRKKIERVRQCPIEIMNSLHEIIKAECLLHNVQLNVKISEEKHLVYVNEAMIKQVMLNLLRNSIEAFPETHTQRVLKIETCVVDEMFLIKVEDNGKGMPESVLNQIEKPFFTTKESGTGIGIPLCKKILEDHGGTFHIDSTYNRGTIVHLSIPLV